MGSSMRKKKEKKKDFQKPKLRVGKTKAKADNFTDTSFRAKSIVLNQQSLTTTAPSPAHQLNHYLSLASSSKSDSQRKDAMSYLCPGGWVKTLNSFMSMLGWAPDKSASKWSSESRASLSNKSNRSFARQVAVLAKFLEAGLHDVTVYPERSLEEITFDPQTYMPPTVSDPFGYLNLFGGPRDEDATAFMDAEARRRVFHRRFSAAIEKGAGEARKTGGETGRAGSRLAKVIREGMEKFSAVDEGIVL
ncbi:pre-rRNA-processing protein IPI1 [Diplocarpon rosae]|nr:pre-rRNA-processing protein IPI1 [Diplocarpon rosae]